ncbi:dual specificity protein phosphatase 14-like [Branchiostoma floridae x Branchiostoma japonicum]
MAYYRVNDHLYFSNAVSARDLDKLLYLKITCIINATQRQQSAQHPSIDFHRISVADSPQEDILKHLDRATNIIHETARKNGRTLVHCKSGVSRAATICIAYVMKSQNLSLREAHDVVRKARWAIRPNDGFWEQLLTYEKRLRHTNSVEFITIRSLRLPSVYRQEYSNMNQL